MTNKLFKFSIDPPTTLNTGKSLLLALDKLKGAMFRIEKMWVQVDPLDAMIAKDGIVIQLSTMSQNEVAVGALLNLDSEYEIFTYSWMLHLAEATNPGFDDPAVGIEVKGIEGTLLECNKKNYITSQVAGQAGATAITYIKILGQYVSADVDDWNYNVF